MKKKDLLYHLYYNYDIYKEQSLSKRIFAYADISPLIDQYKRNSNFSCKTVGVSVEQRPLNLIKVGSGPKKVFMWSQMHGDESTGTLSIFDICNFLVHPQFVELANMILEDLTIYMLPMVNPDGAERFSRNNALNIDLNRDIVRLNSPESKVLYNCYHEINPRFAFNLHDQSPLYSAGRNPLQAVFSFLAPAGDEKKEITDNRKEAMLLIAELHDLISELIPGHTGRYSDDYEPRAFGDYFQSAGAATILIESGGWKEDPEKQYIRRLHTIMLLCALISVSKAEYSDYLLEQYFSIPENEKLFFDILLRNLKFNYSDQDVVLDIGINYNLDQAQDSGEIKRSAVVEEIADLSVFYGLEEYDLKGCAISSGAAKPDAHINTAPAVFVPPHESLDIFPSELLNMLNNKNLAPGKIANFLIFKDNKPIYSVVNGKLKPVTPF